MCRGYFITVSAYSVVCTRYIIVPSDEFAEFYKIYFITLRRPLWSGRHRNDKILINYACVYLKRRFPQKLFFLVSRAGAEIFSNIYPANRYSWFSLVNVCCMNKLNGSHRGIIRNLSRKITLGWGDMFSKPNEFDLYACGPSLAARSVVRVGGEFLEKLTFGKNKQTK